MGQVAYQSCYATEWEWLEDEDICLSHTLCALFSFDSSTNLDIYLSEYTSVTKFIVWYIFLDIFAFE